MNETNKKPYTNACEQQPKNCRFRIVCYNQGNTFEHTDKSLNYIVYCQKGRAKLASNLFKEEFIEEGEIMFLPRMADCRGEILKDTLVIIHSFDNTVCDPENCMLSYLYKHKRKEEKPQYCCKLTAYDALHTFMESITHYVEDNTGTSQLWALKHKELIHLLCRYYHPNTLQSFFHPMTDEEVPFKSLVLSHYRSATYTEELAKLCGYGLPTFRRLFREIFGVPTFQWLNTKKAEHVLYRLSMPNIPFANIIKEFNFSSPQQFNRFCRIYLGDTPTNIRLMHKRQ